jgi:predicted transcriptional regulator
MSTIQEILDRKKGDVARIGKDASVLEAAQRMNERRIGALVVMDGDRVVGIFTERDMLTRIVAAQKNPKSTTVESVMTAPIAYCRPDTTIEEIQSVMTQRRIRHLPVVQEAKLVGIITSGDIMAYEVTHQKKKIEDQAQTIEYLNQYIKGEW